MILAHWLLVLAISAPCSDYRCTDSIAVTSIGGFESREACLSAANLAQKTFSVGGRNARAMCVSTK
jgi:hypothetical protein